MKLEADDIEVTQTESTLRIRNAETRKVVLSINVDALPGVIANEQESVAIDLAEALIDFLHDDDCQHILEG